MKRREPPQIAQDMLVPVLELDEIEKGRKIYRVNDQKEVHWQLNSFTIYGIDNEKQVLIVKDTREKLSTIRFKELDEYVVMKYGYNNQFLWDISFLVLDKGDKLDRKDKYNLHEFCRDIPQGQVSFFKTKSKVIHASGPKQFFDWVKTKEAPWLGRLFRTHFLYDSQTYAFDIEKREVFIKFRGKVYSIKEWIEKNR